MQEAERQYERIRPDAEPPSVNPYAEAQFAADLGRCLRDTGDSRQGIRQLRHALKSNGPGRLRSRCIIEADLAAAHLDVREFEQAATVGRDAIRTATQVSSTRSLDRLRILQRQLRPLRADSVPLAELDDRITVLLGRDRSRGPEPT